MKIDGHRNRRGWGVPELRDAMAEAGFARSDVYARTPGAVDGEGRAYEQPLAGDADLGGDYDVLVVGRPRSSKMPREAAAAARGRRK